MYTHCDTQKEICNPHNLSFIKTVYLSKKYEMYDLYKYQQFFQQIYQVSVYLMDPRCLNFFSNNSKFDFILKGKKEKDIG